MNMILETTTPYCFTYKTDELLIELLGGIRIDGLDRMRVTMKVTVVNRKHQQYPLPLAFLPVKIFRRLSGACSSGAALKHYLSLLSPHLSDNLLLLFQFFHIFTGVFLIVIERVLSIFNLIWLS
jgi:hypothetical protein